MGFFLSDSQNLMMKCADKPLPVSAVVNDYVLASKSAYLLHTWSTFTELETKAFYLRVWVMCIIVKTSLVKAVGCYMW